MIMSISKNLDSAIFRDAMACFASGVTAITSDEEGVPFGMIATSVCSLSVDPATILVCVNKTATIHGVILRTNKFTVNLLSTEHTAVAGRFTSSRGQDRFDWDYWARDTEGLPQLIGAVVALRCDLIATHDAFTHTMFVGKIANVSMDGPHASHCLLWHRHRFAQSALCA